MSEQKHAHKAIINDEEPGYCEDCETRHSVGPELEPEERGCMCGGDILLVRSMSPREAEQYGYIWGRLNA